MARSYADVVRQDFVADAEAGVEGWFVGTVVKTVEEKNFGFLAVSDEYTSDFRRALHLHQSDKIKDIHFRFDRCSAAPISLQDGDEVRFQLDRKALNPCVGGQDPGCFDTKGGKGKGNEEAPNRLSAMRVEALKYRSVQSFSNLRRGDGARCVAMLRSMIAETPSILPASRNVFRVEDKGAGVAASTCGENAHSEAERQMEAQHAFFNARVSFWELCFQEVFLLDDELALLPKTVDFLLRTHDAFLSRTSWGDTNHRSVQGISEGLFSEYVSVAAPDKASEPQGVASRIARHNRALMRAPPLQVFLKELSLWLQQSVLSTSDGGMPKGGASGILRLFANFFSPDQGSGLDLDTGDDAKIAPLVILESFCRHIVSDDIVDPVTRAYRHLFLVVPLVRHIKKHYGELDQRGEFSGSGSRISRLHADVESETHGQLLQALMRQRNPCTTRSASSNPPVRSPLAEGSDVLIFSVMEELFRDDMLAQYYEREHVIRGSNPVGDSTCGTSRDGMFDKVLKESLLGCGGSSYLLTEGTGRRADPRSAIAMPGPIDFSTLRTRPIVHKMHTVFATWEQYWETLFFLSQENCVGSMKHDVKLFSIGESPRHNVRFYRIIAAGYHTSLEGEDISCLQPTIGDTTLVLKPELLPGHSRWEKTTEWRRNALRFGSLVGLTVAGRMDHDVLWMTVRWCDIETSGFMACEPTILYTSPHEGIATTHCPVEITKWIWGHLSQKSQWMLVESPAFFPAHGPVLRTLQERFRKQTDVGTFHDVIVQSNFNCNTAKSCRTRKTRKTKPPDLQDEASRACSAFYLQSDFKVVESLVFKKSCDLGAGDQQMVAATDLPISLGELLTRVENLFGAPDSEAEATRCTMFNYEQLRAVQFALTHKVAIIQGAPGTGKSYMGVRLAGLLSRIGCLTQTDAAPEWQLGPHEQRGQGQGGIRILVLTYKNHALDEFLKHLLEGNMFHPTNIIRVGGGGSEPLLQDRNWSSVKRQIVRDGKGKRKGRRAQGTSLDALLSTREGLMQANKERDSTLERYLSCFIFSPGSLLAPLSVWQRREFLHPLLQDIHDQKLPDLVRRFDLGRIIEYARTKRLSLNAHLLRCIDDVLRGLRWHESMSARCTEAGQSQNVAAREIDPTNVTVGEILFVENNLGEFSKSHRDLLDLAIAAVYHWLPSEDTLQQLMAQAVDGSLNDQAERLAGARAWQRNVKSRLHMGTGHGNADGMDSDENENMAVRETSNPGENENTEMENLEDQEELEARQELEELAGGMQGTDGKTGDRRKIDEDKRIRKGIKWFSAGKYGLQKQSSKSFPAERGAGKSCSTNIHTDWPSLRQSLLGCISAEMKDLYGNFAHTMLATDPSKPNVPVDLKAKGRGGKGSNGKRGNMSWKSKGDHSYKASPHVEVKEQQQSRSAGLWGFEQRQRSFLVQVLIEKRLLNVEAKLVELERRRTLLQRERRAAISEIVGKALRSHKVLGMTISGACIHADIVGEFRPHVVIVEEAGEILEPQLVACLGPWVQHLIMIGDHWQLPPAVEWHELKLRHGFGRSLMERLIDSGLPHKQLMLQSRMHPDISRHLKFKYHALVDNTQRIESKGKVDIFGIRSVRTGVQSFHQKRFFWFDLAGPEDKVRSVINREEVQFCVKLALSFILSGVPASKITILAPYLGQASLIKRAMWEQANDLGVDMRLWPSCIKLLEAVSVSSIDRFQGDENEFVIVSMTRSNEDGSCGFMKTPEGLNRLVVLLSRARGGLYLVGNATCYEKPRGKQWKIWSDKIEEMRGLECLGKEICLQCPRHPDVSSKIIKAHSDFDFQASESNPLCQEICGASIKECGHQCKQHCHSNECNRNLCREIVDFPCPKKPASHPNLSRTCNQKESEVRCFELVQFACQREACGAPLTKECRQEDEDIICRNTICFKCPHCGGELQRTCDQDKAKIIAKCAHKVSFKCGACDGERERECWQHERHLQPCHHPCKRPLQGCDKHSCPRRCGEKCPRQCEAEVRFECVPVCDEVIEEIDLEKSDVPSLPSGGRKRFMPLCSPHPLKRRCCQDAASIKCEERLPFRCAEGIHSIFRLCHQKPASVTCGEPCSKTLLCGHICPRECWEPCPTRRDACAHISEFKCCFCGNVLKRKTCSEIEPWAIAKNCAGGFGVRCVERDHQSSVLCRDLPWEHHFPGIGGTLAGAEEKFDGACIAEIVELAPSDNRRLEFCAAVLELFRNGSHECQHPVPCTCINCRRPMGKRKCFEVTGNELCNSICGKPLSCEFRHICQATCDSSQCSDSNGHDCQKQLQVSDEDPNKNWCAECIPRVAFRRKCEQKDEQQRRAAKEPHLQDSAQESALAAVRRLGEKAAVMAGSGPGVSVEIDLVLGLLEYSQTAVSDTFKNGSTIEEESAKLESRKTHVKDFPRLEVVVYRHPSQATSIQFPTKEASLKNIHFISLDNRRLCTFRLALHLGTRVPVTLWASRSDYERDKGYNSFGDKYDERLESSADPFFIRIKRARWTGDKRFARLEEAQAFGKTVATAGSAPGAQSASGELLLRESQASSARDSWDGGTRAAQVRGRSGKETSRVVLRPADAREEPMPVERWTKVPRR